MARPALAPDGEALLDQLNRVGRLLWGHTYVAKANDFAASTPVCQGRVVRVYLQTGGRAEGLWHWSVIAEHDELSRNAGRNRGYEETCMEAAERAEDAWFRAVVGTSLERRQELRNGYAQAKDPG